MTREQAEPNPAKWCGKLLAFRWNLEVECNLTKGHEGDCKHIDDQIGEQR